jgi:hypothetical protein
VYVLGEFPRHQRIPSGIVNPGSGHHVGVDKVQIVAREWLDLGPQRLLDKAYAKIIRAVIDPPPLLLFAAADANATPPPPARPGGHTTVIYRK